MKITQSIVKDFADYEAGEMCGIVFKSKYIDKTFPDITSKVMNMGCYFEYLLTGALPKSGEVPRPAYLKSALKKNKDLEVTDMMSEYRLIHENVERTKQYFDRMGIKILNAGVSMETKDMAGTIDIEAEWGGNRVIIDTKYSGLLNDRYQRFGWGALKEDSYYGRQQRNYHSKQGIHYLTISGADEFYYFVVSSSNNYDVGLFKINPSLAAIRLYLREVQKTRVGIELALATDFVPHPELVRCDRCPLKNICGHSINYPEPINVQITDEDYTGKD